MISYEINIVCDEAKCDDAPEHPSIFVTRPMATPNLVAAIKLARMVGWQFNHSLRAMCPECARRAAQKGRA